MKFMSEWRLDSFSSRVNRGAHSYGQTSSDAAHRLTFAVLTREAPTFRDQLAVSIAAQDLLRLVASVPFL